MSLNYVGLFFGHALLEPWQLSYSEDSNEKNQKRVKTINQQKLYRQIYKGLAGGNLGSMEEETIEWWKGFGEDLEVDIETITDESS